MKQTLYFIKPQRRKLRLQVTGTIKSHHAGLKRKHDGSDKMPYNIQQGSERWCSTQCLERGRHDTTLLATVRKKAGS